ncbi:MAG: 30S ribosomal protein S7 [Proteobacteria bacterium]|jgi:small subunit ribosomal protein S7|nr:30S ribosomal protein S7 [Pseudomonadota bacterium]
MRRRAAKIRKIFPDAKYKEVIVSRFVNRLMNDGKKSVVEKAIYEAFDDLEKKLKRSSIEIFKEALEVITPKIEVRSRRIGGATYQIPVEVSARRGSALALKWLKISIENIKGRKLSNKVFSVILDSLDNKGWAAKKKEEVFKMAEANKAFAHYRW